MRNDYKVHTAMTSRKQQETLDSIVAADGHRGKQLTAPTPWGGSARQENVEARTVPTTTLARTSARTPPPRLFASISRSALTAPTAIWKRQEDCRGTSPRGLSGDPRGNKRVRLKWMEAIQRRDSSDLPAASTPYGCNSLTAPLKVQSEPVDSSARTGVRSAVPREIILEEVHIDARLHEVRQPRRQKLQSLS